MPPGHSQAQDFQSFLPAVKPQQACPPHLGLSGGGSSSVDGIHPTSWLVLGAFGTCGRDGQVTQCRRSD
jgi:hypothetical protein